MQDSYFFPFLPFNRISFPAGTKMIWIVMRVNLMMILLSHAAVVVAFHSVVKNFPNFQQINANDALISFRSFFDLQFLFY